ncbi:hypothetical protein [Desulfobacter postgatei]|uniref:Uncharacterized protein n=1 Tax=Desulfobacter postgatei 2ac9 TaxID=879212 RepID=I5B177_9BACT|nr:hypothetical protein [Desulfobacter postgatei]EIM63240.1 hypothetical protein DespoDRAFT_01280 [Desulfobacter postgatei 2ac9]
MTTLKFTDGIQIDTSGPIRKLKLDDGWYVTGQGFLIPVKDEKEADQEINQLKAEGSK